MKLLVYSDLHLEFRAFQPPVTQADAVVLAGDIHVGARGVEWAQQTFLETPVIYVCGNHEYYGQAIRHNEIKLKALAKNTNVHVLQNDKIVIDDVTFLGCTLWTDYSLHGNQPLGAFDAEHSMTDFRRIKIKAGIDNYRRIRANDILFEHYQSLEWLRREIRERQTEKLVIVTHHAPCAQSLPEWAKTDPVSAAYASNLDSFVFDSKAAVWIHGHIHQANDYMLGDTRVICNPRGYYDEEVARFLPDKTIEIY